MTDTGKLRFALLGLVVLVGLVYLPGLSGGFVFDDFPNIVDNLFLRVDFSSDAHRWLQAIFSSPSSEMQRPLSMLTFAFNQALTGLDPFWMKVTNLGIHLLNTALVYGLCRELFRQAGRSGARWAALWIAAAWALNPINLTAVLFVVQRMESLCHVFVFGGLWLYLSGRARLLSGQGGWWRVLAALFLCTGLGLAAKESAVLLPLYAFAIEWALLGWNGAAGRRDVRLVGTFGLALVLPAVLGLAWLLPGVASGAAFAGRSFTAAQRLLTEGRVVVDYLHWTLLPEPARMGLYHDDYVVSRSLLAPPSTLTCAVVLAALLALTAWLRRRRPLMALGIAWFLAAQLLTATIIPLELMFEHRNYFASLGLCIALADLLLYGIPTRPLRRLALGLVVILPLAYAGSTLRRSLDWRDPVGLALLEAERHPGSARATYDVARNYVILSRYQANSPYLPRAFDALENAMRVPGSSPLPDTTAIVLAERTGRPIDPRWWSSLQNKLRQHPIGPQESSALASLVQCEIDRRCRFPRERMTETFQAAARQPPNAEVLSIHGNYTLNVLNDVPTALDLWIAATRRAPKTPQYQVSVARLLIVTGRPQEARPYIAKLHAMGRFGQNEAAARALEAEAARAFDAKGVQP